MSMNVNDYKGDSGKKDLGRVDDGSYPARVVQIVNVGKQYKTDWQSGEIETYDDGNPVIQSKMFVTWELPDEKVEIDGEEWPRWYSKEFTISAHEKAALPKLLKVANVTDGDVTKMINAPMLIEIGSTSSGKAKVTGYTKPPKGMEVNELVNEPKVFDPYDPDMSVYNKLPNFIQNKIKEAVDFNKMALSEGKEPELAEDDIEF